MLLTLDIKNNSTFEKLIWLLKHFDKNEIEVLDSLVNTDINEQTYSDEYIKENWKEMLMNCKLSFDYHGSDEYKTDRGEYLMEKYK
jgi:hypothetical protein